MKQLNNISYNTKENAIDNFEDFLHDGLREFIYKCNMDESELNHVLRMYNEYLLTKVKEKSTIQSNITNQQYK